MKGTTFTTTCLNCNKEVLNTPISKIMLWKPESQALAKEASRFDGRSQWHQHLATYNLLGGLTNKFLTKFKTQETKVNDLLTRKEDIPEPESSSAKPISIRENIMLLSGIDHNFGFAEGPSPPSDIETSGDYPSSRNPWII